jgi:hypothetical protein
MGLELTVEATSRLTGVRAHRACTVLGEPGTADRRVCAPKDPDGENPGMIDKCARLRTAQCLTTETYYSTLQLPQT